jgi:hypothetical protein
MIRSSSIYLLSIAICFIVTSAISCSDFNNLQVDEPFVVYTAGKSKIDTFLIVRNPNKKCIQIDSIIGSCSCIEIKYPKFIAPNQSEKIRFTITVWDSTMFTSNLIILAKNADPILIRIFGNFLPLKYTHEKD